MFTGAPANPASVKVTLSPSLKVSSAKPLWKLVKVSKFHVLLVALPLQTKFDPPVPVKVTLTCPATLVSKVAV